VKNNFGRISRRRKQNLKERLKNDSTVSCDPVFSAKNIKLEISEKASAIRCGGIAAVQTLVNRTGLKRMLDRNLHLLKVHKPYHESDHVLNIAYNIVCGGRCLEDIELLRNNEIYMDAIGAKRIPDPTTAGDFLRRFEYDDIVALMNAVNCANQVIWSVDSDMNSEKDAVLDVDGTITKTFGEKKEKMDMSYKGIWGFDPLVITEATTGTHLFVVNRPGNEVSHEGAKSWIDRSIELVRNHFRNIYLRGDSDFSLTGEMDDWDDRGVKFDFAYNASPNLVQKAESLPKNRWKKFNSVRERAIKTKARAKKKNVKKSAIEKRKYLNQERVREYVAEFPYRPGKCKKDYRMIVVKRVIKVTKGQLRFEDKVKYFFYITNITDMSPGEIVYFNYGRCNHENKIEQLYNGVRALKMPASEFMANWAYMVICSLAWNFKSWLGQIMPDKEFGQKVIRMEYRTFLNSIINIPCQIIKSGRAITYRILNFVPNIEHFFYLFHRIRTLRIAQT